MQVLVGRIGRAHGIRGEVVVAVRTDAPEVRFAAGATLLTEPNGRDRQPDPPDSLVVLGTRWHSGRLLVRFDGVSDRDGAEALSGIGLLAEVDPDEQAPAEDEYFDHQLIGLTAVSLAGAPLGQVSGIEHPGAQDLLVLATAGGREVLVPFVAAIVPRVDLAAGQLVLDPPPGLLDLDRLEG